MAKQDLSFEQVENITWKVGAMAEPLAAVRAYVTKKAQSAVNWYYASKKPLKCWGRVFRLGAIALTAIAGVLPLIKEVYQSYPVAERTDALYLAVSNAAAGGTNMLALLNAVKPAVTPWWLNPVLSAVLLAVAATLLALDRFYGTTSGWVRYLLTAQQLTEALDDFELSFETQRASWSNPEPTTEQALAALMLIQKFAKQVNGIVGDETKAWAAEFAEVLKQFDEQMKQANQARRQSAIQVTVTNGDQCKTAWKLTVGSRMPEDRLGREASVEVSSGISVVRASGEISGKAVQAEKAINVTPGEIQKVELTLA